MRMPERRALAIGALAVLGLAVAWAGRAFGPDWGHLGDLGCDLIQGYRLGHPVPAAQVPLVIGAIRPLWMEDERIGSTPADLVPSQKP